MQTLIIILIVAVIINTAIAAIKEKRHFIGTELNKEYFDKACKRIDTGQRQLTLF